MKLPEVILVPLQSEDREQFIQDNQWAFKYGAQQEFGMRDNRCEEGDEVISRSTIEHSIDGETAETYRIVLDGQNVGGVVITIDRENAKGDLELLFVLPECHSKGIGQAAWKAVEALHPEIRVWETITPYFEKRNIHFYVNRCGFQIVEFWNKHQHGPAVPEEEAGHWSEDDEMLVFRKVVDRPPFRPMRRFKQALPEETCYRILENAYRGFLSVNGDGGYPYSVPLNFVFEEGKLYFHCAREGHKLDAIRACNKACFTVLDEPEKEPGDWWYHVKSVICFGRVAIVADERERMARLRSLAGKYFPSGYDTEADIHRNGPNAVVLAFTIEHISGKAVREK